MKRTLIYSFCFWAGIILVTCVDRRMEKPREPSTTIDYCTKPTPDTVSFKNDLIPLFVSNCANPNCHSGNKPEGNLNLEAAVAYDQLTSPSKDYLNTSQPVESLLYNSLTSPANLMPPTGKMPDCKIDLIMKWMGQGAKNN